MIEVYQHCIFVCGNYATGTRTGLHFLYNDTNVDDVMEIVKKYTFKEGVAFYFLTTGKPTIESVKEKDKFFNSMTIMEGADNNNVIAFNNAINNQITVMDIALLLLCRKKMTSEEIKVYLFYIYCIYSRQNNSFPFREKFFFDPPYYGFRKINNEFNSVGENDCFECIKPNIIMSKFFNCDGGVELMNKVLRIFYDIERRDFKYLSSKVTKYYDKCIKTYKIGKDKRRYTFTLSKKIINKLNINLD